MYLNALNVHGNMMRLIDHRLDSREIIERNVREVWHAWPKAGFDLVLP
jgi:hypothetical protein